MPVDVVFPRGNEEEFIELAPRLGYSGLCFVYGYGKSKEYKEKIRKLQENTGLNLYCGFIISLKDVNRIKKTKDLIFIKSSDKDRFIVEKKKADVLFSLEDHHRQDFMHHRASGLNHVLCQLASKNKLIIGFSFNTILKNKKRAYKILGRMMQNIRLCRKYKVKTLIGSFAEKPFEIRDAKDLISLFSVLGMNKKRKNEIF